jgi:hypothetical protein
VCQAVAEQRKGTVHMKYCQKPKEFTPSVVGENDLTDSCSR